MGGAWWSAFDSPLEEPGESGPTYTPSGIQELPIARWDDARRTLRVATLAGLWTTGALGTLVAINRPTLLGEGRCGLGGDPLLGDYGCDELSTVHGMSAVTSVLLYTTSQVLDAAAGREVEQPLWTWTHRVGIAVLPIAGILSRFPEVIGIRSAGTKEDFSKVLRSVHAGVGSLTVLAYTITF